MKLLSTLVLLLFSNLIFAQYYGINTQSNFSNEAVDIEIDASGNQFVTGYLTGQINFDATTQLAASNGSSDFYIAKYAPSGALLWVKQFGGQFTDRSTDLALDNLGNCYVTGQYSGQMTIGSFVLNSTANSKDLFIVKLTNAGVVVWAKTEGGTGIEIANGITCDNIGNVIVTGQFVGQAIIGTTTLNSTVDPSSNLPSYDFFIAKYSSAGTLNWLKNGQAPSDDRGLAVITDSQNNIFVTGQFSDTLTFNGTTYNNIAQNVGFITKLSPAGLTVYFNQLKAGMVVPNDVKINASDEVVITGDFLGTLNYIASSLSTISNVYARKVFVLKTANSGAFIWGKALGSNNEVSAKALAVDGLKNCYITGYFKCDFSQLHDVQTALYNSIGYKDGFFWKLTDAGTTLGVKQFGGKENDEGQGIAVISNNVPILCGSYGENVFMPFIPNVGYTYNPQFGLQNNFPHPYMNGDASRNSFITNAINENSDAINYFEGNPAPTDSLVGFIVPNQDTVHFCQPNTIISYNTQTSIMYGPDYNFTWNNGATTQDLTINQSGTYIITVQRKDLCSTGKDTIIGILHTLPPLPSKTDNLGIAINDFPSYQNYELCYPDSVQIWFNNLCTSCILTLNADTITTAPQYYSTSGSYTVGVSNAYCTNTSGFNITIFQNEAPDTLQPFLYFPSDLDQNDSMVVCAGTAIPIHIYDFLTNPLPNLNQFDTVEIVQETITLANGTSIQANSAHIFQLSAQQSGWQVFTYNLNSGYNNFCGIDTIKYIVIDSIYLLVNPVPTQTITIDGPTTLCPNTTVFISVSPTLPGFNWSGAPFIWQSLDQDSLEINAPGTFSYFGTLTDTLTGCNSSIGASIQIDFKVPPIITANPADGVVCPNDSIQLSVQNNYISYSWDGPYGNLNSNSNTHVDSVMGFYYCQVMDADSCVLTTVPFEIKAFSTPSLFVDPYLVLCAGQSTTITVLFDGNAQIQWVSPFVTNAPALSISQPATYICQIQQCGLTFYDSVTIVDGNFIPTLLTSDSILCQNETAILTVPAGYTDYTWSSGETAVNSIQTNIAGDFYVDITNQFGCLVSTNSITISVPQGANPPIVLGDTICEGANLFLSTAQNDLVSWYTQDTLLLQTSTLFALNQLQVDTLFLVAFQQSDCPMAYQTVAIDVINHIDPSTLINDSLFCSGTSINYINIDSINTINWYENGVFIAQNNLNFSVSNTPNFSTILTAAASNSCFYDSIIFPITSLGITALNFPTDSAFICSQSGVTFDFSTLFSTVYWSLPNAVIDTSSLLMVDNTVGSGYLFAYAIDANGCATLSDSVYLIPTFSAVNIQANLGTDCIGEMAVFTFTPSYSVATWTLPSNTTSNTIPLQVVLSNQTIGDYQLTVIDSYNCSIRDTLTISALPIPLVQLSADTLLCMETFMATPIIPVDAIFNWETYGAVDSIPILSDTWLTLTVTGSNGCVFTDSIYIDAANCDDDLPNVFTPNGDGVNDYFVIDEALLFPNNELIILNRWGQEVYSMNGYNNTFDGGGLHDGVYFYVFYYDTTKPNTKKKEGFLTLIH